MCENNERYDCKTARWIQKQCNACESQTQMMHVQIKWYDAWAKAVN